MVVTQELLLENWEHLHLPIYSDDGEKITMVSPMAEEVKLGLIRRIINVYDDVETRLFLYGARGGKSIDDESVIMLLVTLASCLNPALFAAKENMRLGHKLRSKTDQQKELETVQAFLERELLRDDESELTAAMRKVLAACKNAHSRIQREREALNLYAKSARGLLQEYGLAVDHKDERWRSLLGQLWGVEATDIRGAVRKK
ncbi:hypothetical protein CF138_00820 [Aeromonas hydrophila]|uniref:hypothetical protein n=1 Tax=Aeromonas hydrophila TaxID=644 RepID=UPI001117373C|nr:hypothetical protein [Aeromonas hydrophila]TNH91247.1 hypothetical protein CF138_00820 [Aeromonas hydrophila]TNI02860.1 hypothetical protein CF136_04445 [Aeromonas hydrophila]TNI99430.1 hypothetical protein CF118_03800 [Aeromonas hydrophila]